MTSQILQVPVDSPSRIHATTPLMQQSVLLAGVTITLLVGAVFAFYHPTLSGPFIFDDGANLQRLKAYGDLSLWERMLYFITYDGKSLIQRPLSYLSFFINDHAWPSNPEGFRHTNIAIHAINTLLAFWLSFKLLRLIYPSFEEQQRLLFSGAIALVWALHPIQVNAVAYIIQRMTLLAGTFTFAGLLCYATGRQALMQEKVKNGWIWMSLAIVVCMPLAFLSKQTGVLLPLYILAIETALLHKVPGHQQALRWSYLFVAMPMSAVIIALTFKAHEKVFQWYDALPFGPAERLLTESRILWDYLFAILIPRAHVSSLYHDNYPISHSLLDPPTTLLAIIAFLAAITGAILLRRKTPLLLFAISWFLMGHLLESTIIGLELFYEHRNYLPSFGILFALLVGGYRLFKSRWPVYAALAAIYITMITFVGYLNATKWRSFPELIMSWYQDNPESIRTMKSMTGLLHTTGNYEIARKILLRHQKIWPKSPEPPLMVLLLDCLNHKVTPLSAQTALLAIPDNYWHNNALSELITKLHEPIADGFCPPLTLNDLEKIVLRLLEHPQVHAADKSSKWGAVARNLYYNLAEIGRDQRNLNKAITALDKGNEVWPTTSLYITKMKWLISAGLYREALEAARQALALSRRQTLCAYLNPYETMLLSTIAELQKLIGDTPSESEISKDSSHV